MSINIGTDGKHINGGYQDTVTTTVDTTTNSHKLELHLRLALAPVLSAWFFIGRRGLAMSAVRS
jgi:hypothetical protein